MNSHLQQRASGSADGIYRIMIGAAAAGFLTSLALMLLDVFMGRMMPASAQMQTAFETACVFLWPSAILMLGAQTTRGGAVIFVFAACLNAGYFVFAGTILAWAVEKVRTQARAVAPVMIARQRTKNGMRERLRSPRPAA